MDIGHRPCLRPPYSGDTDDGRFTMPNAPQGVYWLMVWHESSGFLGRAVGRFGTPITIAGPVKTLEPLGYS